MNDKQWEAIFWFVCVGIPVVIVLAMLAGCAELPDHYVDGVRVRDISKLPGGCPQYGEFAAAACYDPSTDTIYAYADAPVSALHHELAHHQGMQHSAPWKEGNLSCVKVTHSGGGYTAGQTLCYTLDGDEIVRDGPSPYVEALKGTSFKPVDIYKLLGVKKP